MVRLFDQGDEVDWGMISFNVAPGWPEVLENGERILKGVFMFSSATPPRVVPLLEAGAYTFHVVVRPKWGVPSDEGYLTAHVSPGGVQSLRIAISR